MPGFTLVERSEHSRADSGERVELLDRRVRAVREERAGIEERAVGVRALGHARPEVVRDVPVGGGMAELDGGGDAELPEARDVVLDEELSVLDARSQAPRMPLVAGLLERVEGV